MISRVIEAKADDMRAFLEEAAGISRYKERRKETESRIADTRENLERLRRARRSRQADPPPAAPGRDRAPLPGAEADERQLTPSCSRSSCARSRPNPAARQAIMNERDLALQAAVAEQRSIEAAIERARQEHDAQSEVLSEVQGRYYEVGAEICRTEQAIDHAREMRAAPAPGARAGRAGHAGRRPAPRPRSRAGRRSSRRRWPKWARVSKPHAWPNRPRPDELTAAETAHGGWQEQWEASTSPCGGASSAARRRARAPRGHGEPAAPARQPARPATQEHGTLTAADVATHAREPRQRRKRTRAGAVETAASQHGRTRRDAAGRTWPRARTVRGGAGRAARNAGRRRPHRVARGAAARRARPGPGQGRRLAQVPRARAQRPPGAAAVGATRAGSAPSRPCSAATSKRSASIRIDGVAGMLDSLTAGTVTFYAGAEGPVASGHEGDTLRVARARPGRPRCAVRGHRRDRNTRRGVAPATAAAAPASPSSRATASGSVRTGCASVATGTRTKACSSARSACAPSASRCEAQQARHRAAEADLEGAAQPRARTRGPHRRAADAGSRGRVRAHMSLRSQLDSLRARAEQRDQRMQQLALELSEVENALESANAGNSRGAGRLEEAGQRDGRARRTPRRARGRT